MKSLIFLLFLAFESSKVRSSIKYPVRLIGNYCIGGQIENGNCKCPDKTVLIGKECKPCPCGPIRFDRFGIPQGCILEGNECKVLIFGHPRIRQSYDDSCIEEFPQNQIRNEKYVKYYI